MYNLFTLIMEHPIGIYIHEVGYDKNDHSGQCNHDNNTLNWIKSCLRHVKLSRSWITTAEGKKFTHTVQLGTMEWMATGVSHLVSLHLHKK